LDREEQSKSWVNSNQEQKDPNLSDQIRKAEEEDEEEEDGKMMDEDSKGLKVEDQTSGETREEEEEIITTEQSESLCDKDLNMQQEDIGFFWDIEYCQVPTSAHVFDVIQSIRSKFLESSHG
jgi:hypothetical protein